MSIVDALVTKLSTITGVTDLIGTLPNMRFTPQRLPDNPKYPAITYHLIDASDIYSHQGYSNLVNTRIQLTVWSRTYLNAEQLMLALKVAFRGFTGTVAGVQIDRVFTIEGPSDYEPITQIHQRNLDLLIGYKE